MSQQKIVVTGDLFRPGPLGRSHQRSNIEWLSNLLGYILGAVAPTAEIQALYWDDASDSFDADHFYQLNDMECSDISWAKLSQQADLPESAQNYLLRFFESVSLVVGYELPPVFVRFFERNNIPYLDFRLHPVRFCDDFYWGANSSHPEIRSAIERFAVSEHTFFMQAGLHKASMSRRDSSHISPNSCLLIGQTEVDSSVVHEGQLLSLLDYEARIDEILATYQTVYFKPHPLSASSDVTQRILEKGALLTTENIYFLLSIPQIERVAGISSSVLSEARCFGKEVEYFHPDWAFESPAVYDAFLSSRFWVDVLSPLCPSRMQKLRRRHLRPTGFGTVWESIFPHRTLRMKKCSITSLILARSFGHSFVSFPPNACVTGQPG